MSGSIMEFQFMSGYVGVGQVILGCFRICRVMSCYSL